MNGMWKQCEVFDGTYNVEDLLDVHEMLRVKLENDKRLRDYQDLQQRVNN